MSIAEKPEHKPEAGIFIDVRDNFHPYECDPTGCIHCRGIKNENHDPSTCALCNFQ